MIFSNVKTKIKELAYKAVITAEEKLGSGQGEAKKKLAIQYIVNYLPFSPIIKTIVSTLLSGFIDDVIEIAVHYMNSLSDEKIGD
ncbi:MAG: hypothetical protein E7Z87_03675 [Cyanobacteria bacterium SIG26]|nr:hypothetical protein [Cyanobacteria bacterium SIG26]MBQ7126212.1 hypothetical protein [bacterium]